MRDYQRKTLLPLFGRNRQCGVSLIEVTVAVGIAFVLTYAATQVYLNYQSTDRKIELIMEEEALRNVIRLKMDCASTIAGARVMGKLLLRDKSGQPIMNYDSSGSMHLGGSGNGVWSLDTYSISTSDGQVDVRVTSPTGETQNLFRKVPLYCPA